MSDYQLDEARSPGDVGSGEQRVAKGPRYVAFISYAHSDRTWWGEPWGRYLHRKIESFKLSLGKDSKPRLRPVFLDRAELAAHGSLDSQIESALADSKYLVVICSPTAARSAHVNQEVAFFKSLGREMEVLCLIIGGEPNTNPITGTPRNDECFPQSVRFRVSASGEVTDQPAKPVAADARRGADGTFNAILKVIATLANQSFEGLRQREQSRQLVRRAWLICGLGVIAVAFASLAFFAFGQSEEANRRADVARARMLAARAPAEQKRLRQDELAAQMVLEAFALDGRSGGEATAEIDQALREILAEPFFSTELLVPPTASSAADALLQVSTDGRTVFKRSLKAGVTQIAFNEPGSGRLHFRDLTPEKIEAVAADGKVPVVVAVSQEGVASRLELIGGELQAALLPEWPAGFVPALLDAGTGVVLARGPSGCHALLNLNALANKPACAFVIDQHVSYARSGDRSQMAVASLETGMVKLMHLNGSAPTVRTIALATKDGPQSIAMNNTGTVLAVGSHTGDVWLYQLTRRLTRRLVGRTPGGSINSITFARGDRLLAAADQEGMVTVWNLALPTAPPVRLRGHDGPVDQVVEVPERDALLSTDTGGRIRRWQLNAASAEPVVLHLEEHQKLMFSPKVHSLAMRPNSTQFVVTGDHGLFQLWDATDTSEPRRIFNFGGPQVHVMAAGFSADGSTVAAATVHGHVAVWSADSGDNPIGRFRLAPSVIPWTIGSMVGVNFLIGGSDGTVTYWSEPNSPPQPAASVHGALIRSLHVDASRSGAFTGADDGSVKWVGVDPSRRSSLGPVRVVVPPKGDQFIGGLAVSPAGALLSIAGGTGVALLDLARTPYRIAELQGGDFAAMTVSFSPDKLHLAAGGSDGVIRVWDVVKPDSKPLLLSGHAGYVRQVAFSPDGQQLISGSYDSTVRIWSATTQALVRKACGLLGRKPFTSLEANENRWTQACQVPR